MGFIYHFFDLFRFKIIILKIAIIPARGGSKRIPRKNIKDFHGKPIIAYSIETAINSRLFDEIMVSTDDDEIAEVAKKYGAQVPFFRSAENSSDTATTADVLLEVVEKYKKVENIIFDSICCIYPTAPLVGIEKLRDGYSLFINGNFDSVFPITPFSYPVWRGLKLEEDIVKMEWPEFYNSRSQDLKTLYHDAGQWYWIKTDSLVNQRKLFMAKSHGFILDEIEVQDIDNQSDWNLAELKYLFYMRNKLL